MPATPLATRPRQTNVLCTLPSAEVGMVGIPHGRREGGQRDRGEDAAISGKLGLRSADRCLPQPVRRALDRLFGLCYVRTLLEH